MVRYGWRWMWLSQPTTKQRQDSPRSLPVRIFLFSSIHMGLFFAMYSRSSFSRFCRVPGQQEQSEGLADGQKEGLTESGCSVIDADDQCSPSRELQSLQTLAGDAHMVTTYPDDGRDPERRFEGQGSRHVCVQVVEEEETQSEVRLTPRLMDW